MSADEPALRAVGWSASWRRCTQHQSKERAACLAVICPHLHRINRARAVCCRRAPPTSLRLWTLAWPLAWMEVLTFAKELIITAFVGRLGALELSALVLAQTLYNVTGNAP